MVHGEDVVVGDEWHGWYLNSYRACAFGTVKLHRAQVVRGIAAGCVECCEWTLTFYDKMWIMKMFVRKLSF
jgi:hypothetical protein